MVMKKKFKFVVPIALLLVTLFFPALPLKAQSLNYSSGNQQLQARLSQLLQIIKSLQAQLQALRARQGGPSFVSSPTALTSLSSSVAEVRTSNLATYETVRGALVGYASMQNVVTQIEKLGMTRNELVGEFPTVGSFVDKINDFGGTTDVATFLASVYNLGARWSDIKADYGTLKNFLDKVSNSFSRNDLPYVNKVLSKLKDLGVNWSDIKTDKGLGGLKELFDSLSKQQDLQAMANLLSALDNLGADIDDLVAGFRNMGDAFETFNRYGNGSYGGGRRSSFGSGLGYGSDQQSPLSDWAVLFGSRSGMGLPPGKTVGGLMGNSAARQLGPCGTQGCQSIRPTSPWNGQVPWGVTPEEPGKPMLSTAALLGGAGDYFVGKVFSSVNCKIVEGGEERPAIGLKLEKINKPNDLDSFVPGAVSTGNFAEDQKKALSSFSAATEKDIKSLSGEAPGVTVYEYFVIDSKNSSIVPPSSSLGQPSEKEEQPIKFDLKKSDFKKGSLISITYKHLGGKITCKPVPGEEEIGGSSTKYFSVEYVFSEALKKYFKAGSLGGDDSPLLKVKDNPTNDLSLEGLPFK